MLPVEYPLPEIVRKTIFACSRLHSTRDSRSTKWNKNGGWAPGHQTGPPPDPDVDPGIFGTGLVDGAGTKRCIAGSGSTDLPQFSRFPPRIARHSGADSRHRTRNGSLTASNQIHPPIVKSF